MEDYNNVLTGLCGRHGITLTQGARDVITAVISEVSHRESFDPAQAARSTDILLMTMAGEHRGAHNAQSVVRAFAKAYGRIPPFSDRAKP